MKPPKPVWTSSRPFRRASAQDGSWRIAPYYHLFGSDELSQRSPVFQQRMPQPYIKLNPADAAKLGVNAGANIAFSYEGQTISLPLIISESLTAGQVGLPMGMRHRAGTGGCAS